MIKDVGCPDKRTTLNSILHPAVVKSDQDSCTSRLKTWGLSDCEILTLDEVA